MPELSRFYGIAIQMNTNDHPPPHFHACYGDEEVLVDIRNGAIYRAACRLGLGEWFENGSTCIKLNCRIIGIGQERIYRCFLLLLCETIIV